MLNQVPQIVLYKLHHHEHLVLIQHNLVDPYHIWMPQGKEDRHLAHHLERDTLARIDKP